MAMNFRTQDVVITHVRGSGPGGQNRNKRWSGVRLVHLPTGIQVVATERRSQAQNLSMAFERLEEKVRARYFVKKARVKTVPSRGAKANRLNEKIRQSKKKSHRKLPEED